MTNGNEKTLRALAKELLDNAKTGDHDYATELNKLMGDTDAGNGYLDHEIPIRCFKPFYPNDRKRKDWVVAKDFFKVYDAKYGIFFPSHWFVQKFSDYLKDKKIVSLGSEHNILQEALARNGVGITTFLVNQDNKCIPTDATDSQVPYRVHGIEIMYIIEHYTKGTDFILYLQDGKSDVLERIVSSIARLKKPIPVIYIAENPKSKIGDLQTKFKKENIKLTINHLDDFEIYPLNQLVKTACHPEFYIIEFTISKRKYSENKKGGLLNGLRKLSKHHYTNRGKNRQGDDNGSGEGEEAV